MGRLPEHKKACEICGAVFRVWPCLENKRKYCSIRCKGISVSINAHKNRLTRIELIKNGAELPMPRRSAGHKHIPDEIMDEIYGSLSDDIDDPDEPTPKQQEEISKSIKLLQENRRAHENQLDTAFHKKIRK